MIGLSFGLFTGLWVAICAIVYKPPIVGHFPAPMDTLQCTSMYPPKDNYSFYPRNSSFLYSENSTLIYEEKSGSLFGNDIFTDEKSEFVFENSFLNSQDVNLSQENSTFFIGNSSMLNFTNSSLPHKDLSFLLRTSTSEDEFILYNHTLDQLSKHTLSSENLQMLEAIKTMAYSTQPPNLFSNHQFNDSILENSNLFTKIMVFGNNSVYKRNVGVYGGLVVNESVENDGNELDGGHDAGNGDLVYKLSTVSTERSFEERWKDISRYVLKFETITNL